MIHCKRKKFERRPLRKCKVKKQKEDEQDSLLPIPNPNPLEIETGLKQKKKLVQFQFWLHLEIGPKVKFQKINQIERGVISTPDSKLKDPKLKFDFHLILKNWAWFLVLEIGTNNSLLAIWVHGTQPSS